MLITVVAVLLVAVLPLLGGSHRALASLRWRCPWLLLLALAVQVVLLETTLVPEAAAPGVHITSYVVVGLFVLANHRVQGLSVLALGALGNGLVIAANAGTMPASPAALRAADVATDTGFVNSAAATDARLWWLGDVFAVPSGLPLANVFSIGDVLILAGTAWVVWAASRPPRPLSLELPRPETG